MHMVCNQSIYQLCSMNKKAGEVHMFMGDSNYKTAQQILYITHVVILQRLYQANNGTKK